MEQSFRNCLVVGLMSSALALGACGDDDGPTDSGTPDTGRVDMGTPPPPPEDMGPPLDMGPPPDLGPADSGPPPAAINVRVAHLTANGPNIKVCMSVGAPDSGMFSDVPTELTSNLGLTDGIPYRGISNYNPALFDTGPMRTGRDYQLRLFASAALPGAVCPTSGPEDGSLFTFVLRARADGSGDVNVGSWYTLAATGLVPDSTTGMLPNVCGLLLNGPCTAGTDRTMGQVTFDVQILEDPDPTDVDADNARVRVFGASPNAPPIKICYDPDGPEDMMAMTGMMPAVPLGLGAIRFGASTPFVDVPMDVTTGTLAVFPMVGSDMDATNCTTIAATGPRYVPLPLPVPAATEAMAERIDCTFHRGQRYTVFTAGIADNDTDVEATDSTVIPWRDSGEDTDTPAEDGCPAM